MKIYTKTGDKGQTSLYGGKRVAKNDDKVEAYGTVDELNSAIGVVISSLQQIDCLIQNEPVDMVLKRIQSDLFLIGAMLAGDTNNLIFRMKHLELRVNYFEDMIDWMSKLLPEQKHFILPGGSISSAHLHVARTICRRAERRVVDIMNNESGIMNNELGSGNPSISLRKNNVSEIMNYDFIIMYLNRLSDFLFTLTKWMNKQSNYEETLWKGS